MTLSRRGFLAGTALGLAGVAAAASPASAGTVRTEGRTGPRLVTVHSDDFRGIAGPVALPGRPLEAGGETWVQLDPPPTRGQNSPTGHPTILDGLLIMQDPVGRMYPCFELSDTPASWEVFFEFGTEVHPEVRAVGIHLWADQNGKCEEIPLHCSITENKLKVTAASASAGDGQLTAFGGGIKDKLNYPQLPRGVPLRVQFSRSGNQLTIVMPKETGLTINQRTVVLTDPRLTGAQVDGSTRFFVLEDERKNVGAAVNGFSRFDVTV